VSIQANTGLGVNSPALVQVLSICRYYQTVSGGRQTIQQPSFSNLITNLSSQGNVPEIQTSYHGTLGVDCGFDIPLAFLASAKLS